jgi:YD repeat-containing protein
MNGSFYKTGGTLALDAPSYISRHADEELFQAIVAGEFCYILDSRQVGKSSLVAHIKRRLEEAGVAVAAVELTALGITSNTPEQWYDALLAKLGEQLGLEDALDDFWLDNERLAPLPRFMEAVRRVVLERIQGPVALFLDEIDVVRSLPFPTDELFAGIRELYNRRTQDQSLERLSVCLIGAAQPTDLIQDTRITPFNIGRRIELTDFTAAEAAPLCEGLPGNPKQAARLLARVHYWTGGHPYLTQRLCRAVAEDGRVTSPRGVDRVCEGLFFTVRARDQEHNLKFVAGQMLQPDLDRAALLDLYRHVRERRRLRDDPTNRLFGALRLAGIVRAFEGLLWVRNRIYYRAFDRDWIQANLPDAEVRRQRAAYRRGALRVGLAAGVTIAALVCGGLWYLDRYRWLHEDYFNAYAKRWGAMEGVGPLTRSDVSHRAVSFKFIRHGSSNPVEAVEAVDATGRCTPRNDMGTYFKPGNRWEATSDKECHWEFVRDNQGQVVYEKAFNAKGRLVWGLVYSPPVQGQPRRAHFVGPNGFPAPQLKSAAEIIEFGYTPEGWEKTHRYFDRTHHPQPDADGAYGQRDEYDARGLLRREISLDARGEPMTNRNLWVIGEADYDDLGNEIEVRVFGTAHQPVLHKEGWHKKIGRYDRYGNLVEWANFDSQGRPTLTSGGYYKAIARCDEHGNQIESAYFDTEGRPMSLKDGYHKVTSRYDERGYPIEWAYFDTAGQPVAAKDGYHKSTARYDKRGNKIERAYFDTEGRPVATKDGYHKVTGRYDERGNQIEWAYFDTEGRPVAMKTGYHKVTGRYDERGNRIEWAYFDTDGNPTIDKKDGTHKMTAGYDERGNRIEWAYFDTAGRPVATKDGYHKVTGRYDERGNRIEWAYFGTAGQPIATKDGYHKSTARYDERGDKTETAYFDVAGQPTVDDKQGVHRTVWDYDEQGKQTREAYFGIDGQPIQNRQYGVYGGTVRYDAKGRMTEIAAFDGAGRPMRTREGFQRRTFAYDDLGRKIEQVDYGLDESQGFACRRVRYDERGNQIETAYFDTEGRPVATKDGYHKSTARYDKRGNKIEWAYFDTEGRPVAINDGYHKSTARYDERGNQIEWAYFDTEGRPVAMKAGYHKSTARYDKRGNKIEAAYFDTEGRPVAIKDGYARVRYRFDSKGRQVEEAFFDSEGSPARVRGRNPLGYTLHKTQYGPDGAEKHILLGFDPAVWGYETLIWGTNHVHCLGSNGKRVYSL